MPNRKTQNELIRKAEYLNVKNFILDLREHNLFVLFKLGQSIGMLLSSSPNGSCTKWDWLKAIQNALLSAYQTMMHITFQVNSDFSFQKPRTKSSTKRIKSLKFFEKRCCNKMFRHIYLFTKISKIFLESIEFDKFLQPKSLSSSKSIFMVWKFKIAAFPKNHWWYGVDMADSPRLFKAFVSMTLRFRVLWKMYVFPSKIAIKTKESCFLN